MPNCETFCKTLGLEAIVPSRFAEYRRPIAEAFLFFLQNLSASRTNQILAEQAALPASTSSELRIVMLARSCPTLHKMGQVLARDRRLPAGLRSLLQGLESMVPSVSGEELTQTLTTELGKLDAGQIELVEQPLAEASVAVVLPFVWRKSGDVRRGVFKVLKPNVVEYLEEELALLPRLGALLDERCEDDGIPPLDYEAVLEQVSERLSHEVRLDVEQQHLREAREDYVGQRDVLIPELFPFCTPRITAMERVDGTLLSCLSQLPMASRNKLARMVCENLIAHPMWSTRADAMFHADPHAGNLMLTHDQRLGILDWSLVARLTKFERIHLSQLLLGAITHDGCTIERAMDALATGDVDHGRLQRVIDGALRQIRQGELPGLAWLTRLMDQAVTQTRVKFGTDLLMFRKVLLTLEGVLADLSEESSVDAMLATSFLTRLGREWGDRLSVPAFSRSLGTHLSNADLMLAGMSGTLSAARYWAGVYRDFWSSPIRVG